MRPSSRNIIILVSLFILSAPCVNRCVAADAVASSPRDNQASEASRLVIDAAKIKEPLSENIYSQFIEHLGRCIYGGIWAEMLEDRKFYFPITVQYNPYRSLRDTAFPVVGASPWQIIGTDGSVSMSTN